MTERPMPALLARDSSALDPPDAIIFDCDGTLALTADIHFDAIGAAAAAQGLVLPRDWYAQRVGLARMDLLDELARWRGRSVDIRSVADDSIRRTVGAARRLARPNPPVAALARRWTPRPMAVASNGEADVVRSILQGAELTDLFAIVVALEDAPRPKPDPGLFLVAAARMAVDPARCLVLEDSDQGLTAARHAGMAAVDVRREDEVALLERLV